MLMYVIIKRYLLALLSALSKVNRTLRGLIMNIMRARTNKGDYVLSRDLSGIRNADEVLSLRADGAYRLCTLDYTHPAYNEVVARLNQNKFVVLDSKICSGLFLPAPTR